MTLNTLFPGLASNVINQRRTNNSLTRLSTGLRINKASDDASGLAIADKLRTNASGINQAIKNANSAVSLLQITDKAMAEISNIIDIVKQKLVQAHTHTTSKEGRKSIKKDIEKLLTQIENISSQTKYNDTKLMNHEGLDFQVGVTSKDTISLDEIDISLHDLSINEDKTIYKETSTRETIHMVKDNKYTLNDILNNSDDLKNVKKTDITKSALHYVSARIPLDLTVKINEEPMGYSSFGGGYYIPKDEKTRAFFKKYVDFVNNNFSLPSSWKPTIHHSPELGEYYRIPPNRLINESADPILLEAQTLNFTTISLGFDTSLPESLKFVNLQNVLIDNFSISEQSAVLDSSNVFEGRFVPYSHLSGLEEIDYNFTYKEPDFGGCGSLEDLKNMPTENFSFDCAGKFQVVVDDALTKLNNYRSKVGSTQMQVDSTTRNLITNYTNIKNAESIIRDVDYAEESSNFNKLNIISQSSTFTQSQYIENKRRILELLK